MTTVLKPIFVKPLSLGTITTGNEVAGHPAAHLGRLKALGMTWKSSGASNLWVRGDMGTFNDVDFCAVLSANAQLATTMRLRLGDTQAEVDGAADYDSGTVPFISPSFSRRDGIYHSFLELPSVQEPRWWRLDFGSHTGDFEAAIVVLGKKVQPSKFYDRDFEYGIEDTGKADITANRIWDEEPGAILRTVDMAFNWITEAEYRADFQPLFEAVGTSQPVYCCFGPEATEYRQDRTYYGKFTKAPYARGRVKPGLYSTELRLLSII